MTPNEEPECHRVGKEGGHEFLTATFELENYTHLCPVWCH